MGLYTGIGDGSDASDQQGADILGMDLATMFSRGTIGLVSADHSVTIWPHLVGKDGVSSAELVI